MIPSLLLAVGFALGVQRTDTSTFANAQTADLFFRARVRHIRQDSLVRDYSARVRTHLEATAGKSRFSRQARLLTHDVVADVHWRAPNDLRVDVRGVRTEAPVLRLLRGFGGEVEHELEEELREEIVLDRPWFIPRALSDSIRLMGVPNYAALHPLADNAVDVYRYAIRDSVTIVTPGRTVRAIEMRIEPKRFGPSLVAGDFWFDAATADLVRMRVVFVGEYLWNRPDGATALDSAEARKASRDADRYLSIEAAVEYALIDQRHWMPRMQMLAITAEAPFFINLTLPARAVTTFTEYRINEGAQFVFVAPPDSTDRHDDGTLRRRKVWRDGSQMGGGDRKEKQKAVGYAHAGSWREGWWEVSVPPRDSLAAYRWEVDPLVEGEDGAEHYVRRTFAQLAELAEGLPPEWTGRRRAHLAVEHLSDVVRFNRVQGLSVGHGYQWRPGPAFLSVVATGRFGLADRRPTGELTLRRDGPGGRLDVRGFRAVLEAEPWTHGNSLGHSLNTLLTGHEYADFYLSTGGGLAYTWNGGLLRHVTLAAAYERHASMETRTGSAIADWWGVGSLPPNAAVVPGDFFHGSLVRDDRIGFVALEQGVELMTGETLTAARGWASMAAPFELFERGGQLTVRAGATRGDALPQLAVGVGGLETVRGYSYRARMGREFWAAQLDYALVRTAYVMPVGFVDVGDSFTGDPLVGAGLGFSLLNGFMRFNLSKGLRPATDVRFDLHFRAPR